VQTLGFTRDATCPTASISSAKSSLVIGQTTSITFTFSEDPGRLSLADMTVSGGSLTGLAVKAGDPRVYTALFTPGANIDKSVAHITLNADSYADLAGNKGAMVDLAISIDTLAPRATFTTSQGSVVTGEIVTYTVTFSEAPQGLTLSDFLPPTAVAVACNKPQAIRWCTPCISHLIAA